LAGFPACYTEAMTLFTEAQLREIRWNILGKHIKWLHPLYWWERWRYGPVVNLNPPLVKFGPASRMLDD
tara:strand:- start:70120 stop:70326 length:207 start_codon:yes stop_codon:yes gene_type:complete